MPPAQSIAFVCPRFASGSTVGGAETLMKSLAAHAMAAGRRVAFLTTCATSHFTWKNELPPGRTTLDGMDVHFFPVDETRDVEAFLRIQQLISRRCSVSRADQDIWLRNSVNSPELCAFLRDRGDAYDRIVVGPYLFGLTAAVCLIHPARTLLVPCLHDEPFAYLEAFQDIFLSVRRLVFNSAPERDLARKIFGLSDARTRAPSGPALSVVGMGLDPFDVDPEAFAKRHKLSRPYIAYGGRREPMKGTPLLIDYLTTFRSRTGRDIALVLTGSGPVEMPAEMTPHIMDMGVVDEQVKREVMAGALAFCHPSTNESFGIVILESWLAGTPVLVHGQSRVLRDHCVRSNGGLWFRTYPEFEEELLLLLDSAETCRGLGEAGRQYVLREYSWESIEAKLLQALDG